MVDCITLKPLTIMESTDKITEKVYCYGHPGTNQNTALETAALMNGGLIAALKTTTATT